MRTETEKLYDFLQKDLFAEDWLCEISSLKNENFIIYDEEGTLINGSWYEQIYSIQKPGVKSYNNQNFAIYDTRYNETGSVEKKYSEFIHELFHCLQLRKHVDYKNCQMIEGAALFVESIVLSRYIDKSVDEIIEQYGKYMLDKSYIDYFLGAEYMLKKFYSGLRWKDYFSMEM